VAWFALRASRRQAQRQATELFAGRLTGHVPGAGCAGKTARSATGSTCRCQPKLRPGPVKIYNDLPKLHWVPANIYNDQIKR
jgi:hypothetical protein